LVIAELDGRRSYLGEGPGSVCTYCREVLGYSEDAAWNRAASANVVRRFPVVLGWLADGTLNVTTVRMLRPVLTTENHLAVLKEARRRSKREVELIVRRLDPKPDVPSTIRRVSAPAVVVGPTPLQMDTPASPPSPPPAPSRPTTPEPRPVVAPLTPERYRLQFTVSRETHDKLRRLQDLLCREIRTGDPAVPRAPRGLEARRRAVRVQRKERTLLGAALSRVAPRPTVRPPGPGDGGQHLAAVPGAQRLRERAGVRPLRFVDRSRGGGGVRCFRDIAPFRNGGTAVSGG
jgi:hypothetical protein